MPPDDKYELEKDIWTNADFEVMGWHDSIVWAMSVVADQFEFIFDLDYIFKWVRPVPPEQYFSFWVSPVTLVFEGVQHIKMNMDLQYVQFIEIADINREGPVTAPDGSSNNWKWRIELQQGDIEFEARAFTQFVRKAPIVGTDQSLSLDTRGGLSFARQFA